jgi:hypothetical protein
MARTLGCLLGRHQWCIASSAGGDDADCWNCGKRRRKKVGAAHPSTTERRAAARARDEAFAIRDSNPPYGSGVGF